MKEGIDFAREYGCLFLECSEKTKVNVEHCFEELVLKVQENVPKYRMLSAFKLFKSPLNKLKEEALPMIN